MLSVLQIIKFLSEKQEKIPSVNYNNIYKFELNEYEYENIENIKNNDFIFPEKEEEPKVPILDAPLIINKDESYSDIKKEYKSTYNNILPQSFDIIFNKSIKNFYYDNKISRNKSNIFSLLNSILLIVNETFNLNKDNEKECIIKEFIKKIDSELFELNLYTKFNYQKNRKFNKVDIQSVLKNALLFKSCEKIKLLKQYLSDYLGINIYILNKFNNNIDFVNSEYFLCKKFGDVTTKFLPNFIIIHDNEIYKPLLKNNNENIDYSSIIRYNDNKDIIDNLWKYYNIVEENIDSVSMINVEKEKDLSLPINEEKNNPIENRNSSIFSEMIVNENKKQIIKEDNGNKDTKKNILFTEIILSKLKVEEIKKICIDNNIELLKKSDKTNKMINKLKNELIFDLINL